VFVKKTQLARRVDEQAFDLAVAASCVFAEISLAIKISRRARAIAPEFAAALKMPRHQHEKNFGKPRAQFPRDFRQDEFLAVVRAAADQDWRVRRHAELPQQRRNVERPAFVQFRRVKFQIADDMDGFRPAADFAQARGVLLILSTPTPANDAKSGRNKNPNRL
jgi:hypothetical protein